MRTATSLLCALTLLTAAARADHADHRHDPLVTLNGPFRFDPPADRAAWDKRAAELRLQLRVALGLHPWPGRTPMQPVVHGWVDCGDYRVGRVYFQSMPGHFVTGSLYMPAEVSGKIPGVLCPHGHWPDGRFMVANDAAVKAELDSGAETDEEAARSPLQARCVHLARMGCAVFHFDMIGYADSVQIPMAIAHGFREQRPDMNDPEAWGLFSPQAESRAQSVMGLQTWNAVRALDFLAGLPEVDPDRIGVTGASGGGTQTFLLGAVDPRPAAIFPAVMVSGEMQGGCTCENASLLRTGTCNIEIAALFAPKPLGMTAADDWTKNMDTNGFPELRNLYATLGAPDNTMLFSRTEFPHNYNLPSRLAMYRWMAAHLKTPKPAPEAESPFRRLTRDELTVWDDAHPAPAAGDPDSERALLRWWDADATRRIAEHPALVDEALPVIVGRSWERTLDGNLAWKADPDRDSFRGALRIAGTLTHESLREQVRCTFLYPPNWNRRVIVFLDAGGTPADPSADAVAALEDGAALAWPELWGDPLDPDADAPHVEGDRDFAGYTLGYNPPPLARRAHDILTLLAFLHRDDRKPERIDITAGPAAVPETALALTRIPKDFVHTARLSPTPFRFASLRHIHSPHLVPAIARYGDLPALLARSRATHTLPTP